MPWGALWALSVLFGAGCGLPVTEGPRSSGDWDAHLARAAVVRAETLHAQGDDEGALLLAQEALQAAEAAGNDEIRARALTVLGRVQGRPEVVAQAAVLSRDLTDGDAATLAELALAEQLIEQGRPHQALANTERLLPRLERIEDREARARLQVRTHLLRVRAHRARGETESVAASARRAQLALSLLPGEQMRGARFEAAMEVALGYRRQGDHRRAFSQHVRAADLARALKQVPAEIMALRAMGEDLAGMGRLVDALDHTERALRLCLERGDPAVTREIAQDGLAMLHTLGIPDDSPRVALFRRALYGEE